MAIAAPILDEAIDVRRDIHAYPELAFEEVRTAEIVAHRLEKLGLAVHRGIGKTGVVGILAGNSPGPTIMLRADMDGLAMQEESSVPYRSRNPGAAHACGHDGHVAMLLGAARVLATRTAALRGRIAFVFQPAEEASGGAKAMLDDGLIERFAIVRAFGLHLTTVCPTGVITTKPGPLMAAVDEFELVVEGRGGHGAMPHRAVDPIVIAAELVGTLQRIVSREIDPIEPAVFTIGSINGGTASNVIPPRVILKGTVRTLTDETRDGMEARIRRIAEHICAASGAGYRLDWHPAYPVTINDVGQTTFVRRVFTETFGAERVIESPVTMGSEDFAYYGRAVPACFVFLGAGDAAHTFPNHHPAFDFVEAAMSTGIAMHVAIAEHALHELP